MGRAERRLGSSDAAALQDHKPFHVAALARTVTLALLISACGRSVEPGGDPAFDGRGRDPSRLWTVRPIASSSDSALLTSVVDAEVGSDGTVYVADGGDGGVIALSPTGAVLRSIGRQGDGPGEYRAVTTLQLLRGDSVLVYDRVHSRITIFPPDSGAPVWTQHLSLPGAPAPYWAVRTEEGDAIVAAYRRPSRPDEDPTVAASARDVLRVFDSGGHLIRDSLLLLNPRQALVVRSPGNISRIDHPIGRRSILRVAGGKLFSVWTDSAAVEVHTLDGRREGRFAVHVPAVPVTSTEMDSVLSGLRPVFHSAFRESAPETWPPVRGLVADDASRIWLGLATRLGSPGEWAAFDSSGAYLGSITLPWNAELKAVRDDHAYAVQKDEFDVPRIVAYRIVMPST